MKLERFEKNKKKKVYIVLSITVVLLVSVFVLYKSFALYEERKEFNVINGVIPDFNKSDIKLAYTINGNQSNEAFPNKEDNYQVKSVECEKGVTASWNSELWGLVDINSNGNKTISCTVNFKKEITLTNLIINGSFENGLFENCIACSLANNGYDGDYSLRFDTSNSTSGIMIDSKNMKLNHPILNHKYYGFTMFKSSNDFSVADNRFEWFLGDEANQHIVFAYKDNKTTEWIKLSAIGMIDDSSYLTDDTNWFLRNFLINHSTVAYIDAMVIVDLTESFGAGNEPSKEWCDKNINYFDGATKIYY